MPDGHFRVQLFWEMLRYFFGGPGLHRGYVDEDIGQYDQQEQYQQETF